MKIEELDKNLKVDKKIDKSGLAFYNALDTPFKIYGVHYENGKFRRMPESVAKTVSEGVTRLHTNCAGGRVRFRTDSGRVAIVADMGEIEKMPHFALTGSAGFDMYIENNYERTFIPPYNMENGYESVVSLQNNQMNDITINFPRGCDVSALYIGLDETAKLEAPTPYIDKKPIVYYGSSITQGGCASRPGNCYQAYISRRFNCDYINLGFSGNCRAETPIIDYIKKLDMSIFVYDYDYNTPDSEYLKNTHEKSFKAIRRENPTLPIIIMPAPVYCPRGDMKERRDIVEATYRNAVAAGDKNVYFINGDKLMELCENNGTVDNIHPNDFGFASMAKAVGDVIEQYKLI